MSNLAWSSASKVIFHVGDAPQHGERFHDMGPQCYSYYSGDPSGLHPEDLFKCMKQIGLRYFFGKVNNSTDKMFNVLQSLGGERDGQTSRHVQSKSSGNKGNGFYYSNY